MLRDALGCPADWVEHADREELPDEGTSAEVARACREDESESYPLSTGDSEDSSAGDVAVLTRLAGRPGELQGQHEGAGVSTTFPSEHA